MAGSGEEGQLDDSERSAQIAIEVAPLRRRIRKVTLSRVGMLGKEGMKWGKVGRRCVVELSFRRRWRSPCPFVCGRRADLRRSWPTFALKNKMVILSR